MKLKILGVGLWTRGIHGYSDFIDILENEDRAGSFLDSEFTPPKPTTIPTRERRRAGLIIKLAVEVAHQTCEHAGIDKSQVPSVFASAVGDTDITDYMCKKLAQPEKLLSPTKFHNSVHNAPAGYWSISAENRAPSTFVGGYRESFGAGLFEAAAQAMTIQGPVLLVAYDIANQAPWTGVSPVAETMACGIVIAPQDMPSAGALDVRAELEFQSVDDVSPCLAHNAGIRALAQANPMGCALTLFERFTLLNSRPGESSSLQIPAAPNAVLNVDLATGS